MFPADRDPVPTAVEYDSRGSRAVRLLPDIYAARRFFTKADRMGLHPHFFHRSDSMDSTVETTPVVETTKKSFKKAKVKKLAVEKKSAVAKKKTAIAKSEPKVKREKSGPSPLQLKVLVLLNKKGALSRSQISESLDGAFIGGNVMGHANPDKRVESSLYGRGLVKFAANEEGRGVSYEISAAGKKLLGK